MKLQVLIVFSLTLVLASGSKGQDWNITVPGSIKATLGSDVTIQCTFAYPEKNDTGSVQVYWKMNVTSNIAINDMDRNAFIYHTNESFVLPEYRNRTQLIADKSQGSCSMKIQNVRHDIIGIYVRIAVANEKYSFKKRLVSIFVQDEDPFPTLYVVIAAAASAVLIIIIVSGCLCYRKHRRSEFFTREESGYYANFSRASSNPQVINSEATCKAHDNMKNPEPKAVDEPVYVNTEALTAQMTQRLAHKEVIYENVN